MILAEYLAFEILTLSASFISSTHLATQSVLSTISTLTYQIPFPISIAASTRVANLVGATLTDAGKLSAKVAFVAALIVGILNMILLSSTRNFIPYLFTNDPDVAELTSKTLPLNAAFQLFDALAALCNGILRGLGRQEFGSYVNLFAYYVVSQQFNLHPSFRTLIKSTNRSPCLYPSVRGLGYTGISTVFGPVRLSHWASWRASRVGSSTGRVGKRRPKTLRNGTTRLDVDNKRIRTLQRNAVQVSTV